jgi:energy-coupling factor transporter ATP-binding protein EcfA2
VLHPELYAGKGQSVTRVPQIQLHNLSFAYPNADLPVLREMCLEIHSGELILVVGPSGSGKSTLLRTLNGLVPHFSGGRIAGRVQVDGHDPVAEGPHRMSTVVGLVQQDPEAQFVVDTVEDELAFGMENQGLAPGLMRQRIEQVLDQLGIAHLRHRRISTLSAGEKQRVAIGSVLTLQPRVLVLDEPTSQLDPQAAEEVLNTLRQLNSDLGLTIILSEHRLERVVQYAHRIVYIPALGEAPLVGRPQEVLLQVPFAPPLVQLAKALGWRPVPLTIEEARPFAAHMGLRQAQASPSRSTLMARRVAPPLPLGFAQSKDQGVPLATGGDKRQVGLGGASGRHSIPHSVGGATGKGVGSPAPATGPTHMDVRKVWYSYSGVDALRGISLRAQGGELIALMGRNGSGKTTLLKHMVGLLRPRQGHVIAHGLDTREATVEALIRQVGYVPQDPSSLLFADTVRQELEFTRRAHALSPGDTDHWLETLGLAGVGERYPRDLSVGERQRVALAAILVAEPMTLLLDEPTRGLDPLEKEALGQFLQAQTAQGRAVIIATHDVELAAECADRVIIINDGQVVADGPAREVMSQSLTFASQVNKLFGDPRLLTVQDVLEARADPAKNAGWGIDES